MWYTNLTDLSRTYLNSSNVLVVSLFYAQAYLLTGIIL